MADFSITGLAAPPPPPPPKGNGNNNTGWTDPSVLPAQSAAISGSSSQAVPIITVVAAAQVPGGPVPAFMKISCKPGNWIPPELLNIYSQILASGSATHRI